MINSNVQNADGSWKVHDRGENCTACGCSDVALCQLVGLPLALVDSPTPVVVDATGDQPTQEGA